VSCVRYHGAEQLLCAAYPPFSPCITTGCNRASVCVLSALVYVVRLDGVRVDVNVLARTARITDVASETYRTAALREFWNLTQIATTIVIARSALRVVRRRLEDVPPISHAANFATSNVLRLVIRPNSPLFGPLVPCWTVCPTLRIPCDGSRHRYCLTWTGYPAWWRQRRKASSWTQRLYKQ
jgi:hypothetical protein